MKLSHAFTLSFLSLFVATGASASNCINKDLINLGPTAYDVGILITGNQPITWRYDGYPSAVFKSFKAVMAGPNEFLHWRNVNGVDAPILTGDLVHVGWCTPKPNNIVDMWWTDLNGGRVPGSVIYQIAAHSWNGPTGPVVRWDHNFVGDTAIVVSGVRAATSDTPWDLEQLNRENTVLAEQLRPLPGGTSFQVLPGRSVDLPLPADTAPGQWVVVVYQTSGPCSQASSLDFVQFQVQ